MNMQIKAQSRHGWLFGVALLGFLAVAACDKSTSEKIGDIYQLKLDPTPENIETLRGLLDDKNADLRVTALSCLVTLEVDDAAELAVAGLEDGNAFVRATAAKLVGDLEDSSLAGFLIRRLKTDPDPLVRRRACQAMAFNRCVLPWPTEP